MAFCCVICREAFQSPFNAAAEIPFDKIVTTQCGHMHHSECIKEWLRSKGNEMEGRCPYCRQKINLDELIDLFPLRNTISDVSIADPTSRLQQGILRCQEDLDGLLNPTLNTYGDLMHYVFCIFMLTILILVLGPRYLENQTYVYISSDEDNEDESESVLVFGYFWAVSILLSLGISIVFQYWTAYMNQMRIYGYFQYLWLCFTYTLLDSI